jgi:hypothetical protein
MRLFTADVNNVVLRLGQYGLVLAEIATLLERYRGAVPPTPPVKTEVLTGVSFVATSDPAKN